MHILTKRAFGEAARRHPNQRAALLDLYRDKWWVLDVGGRHLRMIACIQFRLNRMFVKHIVTHAEYDRLCDRYRRGGL